MICTLAKTMHTINTQILFLYVIIFHFLMEVLDNKHVAVHRVVNRLLT